MCKDMYSQCTRTPIKVLLTISGLGKNCCGVRKIVCKQAVVLDAISGLGNIVLLTTSCATVCCHKGSEGAVLCCTVRWTREDMEEDAAHGMASALTMSEEEFFASLRQSVTSQTVFDLTDRVVCITTAIKLARGESLSIKNGTILGECHSIFSMGTDRGYDNGPPALTLEGVKL